MCNIIYSVEWLKYMRKHSWLQVDEPQWQVNLQLCLSLKHRLLREISQ